MESERDIIQFIKTGNFALPPISFAILDSNVPAGNGNEADLLLEGRCAGKQYRFAIELKRYSSDKVVSESANQARNVASGLQANPMIMVPWLSETQLTNLEKAGVSGVDLCGNGIVIVPGELLIFRTGQPNKYPLSRTVKRVYQGTSSLVPRVFLAKPTYASVSEVLSEITARGGITTLSTVSKALSQMEDDLIIEKTKEQIRLLQADKLLDRLAANYEQPKITDEVRCKLTQNGDTISRMFRKLTKESAIKVVLSGTSSVDNYATMAREPLNIYFCSKNPVEGLRRAGFNIDTESRFPNTEFKVTDSELLYFDMRTDKDKSIFASPVQTYLELTRSDKRGQETAKQVRQKILKETSIR